MSTARPADPQLVDDARQQIRALVAEVEQLSKSDISPGAFYEGFLQRVVSALAAVGGAVWAVGDDGRLKLAFQINLRETGLVEGEDHQLQHGRLLHKVRSNGEGLIVAPHSSGDAETPANPSDFLLVLGALKSDREVQGVVEIFQRSGGRPAVERGYLRFLLQMCDLASTYLQTRSLRHFSSRQLLWSQLETFARTVHQSLDPRLTAYTIANEGRRLIECDRVSIAIRRGNKCRVEAVSGQETFDKRSNVVSMLGDLATAVVATGDDVWYSGDTTDFAPQVESAIQAYVDESHSKTVAVLPLKRIAAEVTEDDDEPEVVGALIVEQIEESTTPEGFRHRVEVVRQHSSSALANALEHNNLFLMPLWRAIGRTTWVLRARTLPKTIAATILVLLLLAGLVLIPADFDLEGRGTLEPVLKRDVFASIDGSVVDEIHVEHGQLVKEGDLLVTLRNYDLESNITDVEGRLAATQEQLTSVQRSLTNQTELSREEQNRLSGQFLQLRKSADSLRLQLGLLMQKREQLLVRSPINGQVVTWELREKLIHRPVERGQVLVTVANPGGEWELQINMPENRMGHIARAQKQIDQQLPVTYILATSPGQQREGQVSEVHAAAEVRGDQGNTVLVRVAIDQPSEFERRPGATATAKVHCGTRSIGYVWFHDLIAFVQSRVLFRL